MAFIRSPFGLKEVPEGTPGSLSESEVREQFPDAVIPRRVIDTLPPPADPPPPDRDPPPRRPPPPDRDPAPRRPPPLDRDPAPADPPEDPWAASWGFL